MTCPQCTIAIALAHKNAMDFFTAGRNENLPASDDKKHSTSPKGASIRAGRSTWEPLIHKGFSRVHSTSVYYSCQVGILERGNHHNRE
jgi:hypothetical protein